MVHDDVIDGDTVRRGSPNVAGTFANFALSHGASPAIAQHYGETAGILAGDLALAGAIRMIATSGAPPQIVTQLLDLTEHVLQVTAAGELADVRVAFQGSESEAEVLEVAEWKTAAYSFQLPLQAGGILAGAESETVGVLGEVGRLAGIAFQLRDDIDGAFGDPKLTGKSTLADLRSGKNTALILHARGTTQWPEISRYVGNPDMDEAGVAEARRLLEEAGSLAYVSAMIESLRTAASGEAAKLPSSCRQMLDQLFWLVWSLDRSVAQ